MRLILLATFSFITFTAFCQEEAISFQDALKPHLKKYNIQSDIVYENGDIAKGEALFDSLVRNYLVGSKFSNYSLKNVSGGKVKLGKSKKPVFLITYASWCVLNKGEIGALNKLSRKHGKHVEFVVLFWDKKENVKSVGRKFGGRVKVCYANEAYRNDVQIVSTLKHTLGFPTSYFLNSNLEVVDIKRGGASIGPEFNQKEAFALNYALFNQRISDYLLKKDIVRPQLTADTGD